MQKIKEIDKIVNFRFMVFLSASLCCGIGSAYFLLCENVLLFVATLSLFVVCNLLYVFVFTIKEKRRTSVIFALIFSFIFIVGHVNFSIRVSAFESANLDNHYYITVGKIESKSNTDNGDYLVLTDVSIEGIEDRKLAHKVAVFVEGNVAFDIGDVVFFNAKLKDKSCFYDGKFSAYDVQRGIKYMANVSSEEIFYSETSQSIFEIVNLFIRDNLKQGLDKEQFSLSYAMLTGNDEYIAPDTISSYRQAGVAHVFAVSGLHIGFLATVLNFILKKLHASKMVSVGVIVPILLFYSGVCNFSASSVRAVIMSTVLIVTNRSKYKYDKFTSIAISSFVVLMISPIELLCAGFQLSFGIVFGMFVLAPVLTKLLKFLPNKINSSLSSVLSAQLSAIPISLMVFNEFSVISVIANVVIIPLVGVVFIMLWIALIIGALFSIGSIAFFVPNFSLTLVNALVSLFDGEIFMVGGFTLGAFIVFYYILMIIVGGLVRLKEKSKMVLTVALSMVCVVGTVLYNVNDYSRERLYVSGTEKTCFSIIEKGQASVLIVSGLQSGYSLSRLERMVKRLNDKEIELVVFTKGIDSNEQAFLSRLNRFCSFKEIRYAGPRNQILEIAVLTSFPNVEMNTLDTHCELLRGGISLKLILDGYMLEMKTARTKIGVVADLSSGNVDYTLIPTDYNILLAGLQVEELSAIAKPNKTISFFSSSLFEDAEEKGNLEYLI